MKYSVNSSRISFVSVAALLPYLEFCSMLPNLVYSPEDPGVRSPLLFSASIRSSRQNKLADYFFLDQLLTTVTACMRLLTDSFGKRIADKKIHQRLTNIPILFQKFVRPCNSSSCSCIFPLISLRVWLHQLMGQCKLFIPKENKAFGIAIIKSKKADLMRQRFLLETSFLINFTFIYHHQHSLHQYPCTGARNLVISNSYNDKVN